MWQNRLWQSPAALVNINIDAPFVDRPIWTVVITNMHNKYIIYYIIMYIQSFRDAVPAKHNLI